MNQTTLNTNSLITTRPTTSGNSLPEAIATQFRSILMKAGLKASALAPALIENTYFITMRFDEPDKNCPRNDHSSKLRWFEGFHKSIVQEGLGHNNLKRKLQHQPLCYAFLDFPGSRYQPKHQVQLCAGRGLFDQTTNTGGLAALRNVDGVHIHAVLLIKPGFGEQCRDPLLTWQEVSLKQKNPELMIEQFDPSRGSLEDAITYCAKGYERLAKATGQLTWNIYGTG